MKIRLTESVVKKLINDLLNESAEAKPMSHEVFPSGWSNEAWENYVDQHVDQNSLKGGATKAGMKKSGGWPGQARKMGYPGTFTGLKKFINDNAKGVSGSPKAVTGKPVNKIEGDQFRAWVNDNKSVEEITKLYTGMDDKTLDRSGKIGNNHFNKAWAAFGNEYIEAMKPKDDLDDTETQPEEQAAIESDRLVMTDLAEISEDVSIELAAGMNKNLGPVIISNIAKLKAGKNVIADDAQAVFPGMDEALQHCAEWVNYTTGASKGSAWIQGRDAATSAFNTTTPQNRDELTVAFNYINKTSANSIKKKDKTYNSIRSVAIKSLIPAGELTQLSIGTIVGLIYKNSGYYSVAFFENASGKYLEGPEIGESYFQNKDTGELWKSDDLGKDIEYIPSPALSSNPFPFNTHIGIVGAKIDGAPIIFHNVHGTVRLTPLSALTSGKEETIGVSWHKPGPSYAEKQWGSAKTMMIDTAKEWMEAGEAAWASIASSWSSDDEPKV